MSPEQIAEILKARFGDAVIAADMGAHPQVIVAAGHWPEVARFLRDEPALGFNMLRSITAVDRPAEHVLEALYDLLAMTPPEGAPDGYWTARHAFAVRIRVDRGDPHIPSVAHVWPAADWHEREAYDLLGIVFDGHPDSVEDHDGLHPRRILCPDDWAGHPLRKDYVFPIEYHGIPGTTEYETPNPVH